MGTTTSRLRNIKRFLEEGDKCKITLRFRGREITHQELGMALLQRIRDELGDTILVEQFPKLEGRQMIMMIAPGRKKPVRQAGRGNCRHRRLRLRPEAEEFTGLPDRLVAGDAARYFR
jgi:hypothetical protein